MKLVRKVQSRESRKHLRSTTDMHAVQQDAEIQHYAELKPRITCYPPSTSHLRSVIWIQQFTNVFAATCSMEKTLPTPSFERGDGLKMESTCKVDKDYSSEFSKLKAVNRPELKVLLFIQSESYRHVHTCEEIYRNSSIRITSRNG
jgi:hypothetical protein